MSNQTIIGVLAGALLIVILILGGILGFSLTRPAQAQIGDITARRNVTVVGTGEARGRPDTANIQIGVENSAATPQEALNQNNTQVAALISQLRERGVAEQDIQTSNFNIYPNYSDEGRQITGYTVSNTVAVTIRTIEQTGELLNQVVQVGANRIYGISFTVEDPDALLAQARDEALANARAKAEQLAQGSNATIGRVLVITENVGTVPPPIPLAERADLGQGAGQVPIQSGEQLFTTQVQVTFELN